MSNESKIAERLLAHARLCRQIAVASWSEAAAEQLAHLADECDQAAAQLDTLDCSTPPGSVQ